MFFTQLSLKLFYFKKTYIIKKKVCFMLLKYLKNISIKKPIKKRNV